MTTRSTNTLVPEPPVWLITGCSTGFGREIAKLAISRGFRAVVTARELSSLEPFAAAENALLMALDVTQPAQVDGMLREAEARFGETLAFAAEGKVKADIELQPLSAINNVFSRLAHGDVPSRVVLDFAPH